MVNEQLPLTVSEVLQTKSHFQKSEKWDNITGTMSRLELRKKLGGNWHFPWSRPFWDLENIHLCVALTQVKPWRTFLSLNTCSEMTPCQFRPVILLEIISVSHRLVSDPLKDIWKKWLLLLNLCNIKVPIFIPSSMSAFIDVVSTLRRPVCPYFHRQRNPQCLPH